MKLQCHLKNSVRAKRLWKMLKIVLSVIRKTKVIHNLIRKSDVSNFIMSRSSRVGSFGVSEYEFSCTNSPNPVFFRTTKKKPFFLFPMCFCFPNALEEDFGIYTKPSKVVLVPDTPDYLCTYHLDASFDQEWYDNSHSLLLSPNNGRVRVSDYLSVEEEDGSDKRVDHEAEEFIRKFYEQLRLQSPINLKY